VIEKTIIIFRNKKPKNLKFGLLWLGFLKAISTCCTGADVVGIVVRVF